MFIFLISVLYLAFISLGLPDSVLGSAWPSMFVEMDVPVSYAGIISAIIAFGTIISSLMSDRITFKLGSGKTTFISIIMTALALLGFSFSTRFWMLCIFAIPYGLGAGSVDASLNNYVALHYSSKHMSWLHCMWGLGASIGPAIMSYALTGGQSWRNGYLYISIIQFVISFVVLVSLPLWKSRIEAPTKTEDEENNEPVKPLSLRSIISIPGAKAIMLTFFCYCAIEVVVTLWASTYLNLFRGIDAEISAAWGSLFLVGITVGRAINGFISMRLSDTSLIRIGQGIILLGEIMIIIPISNVLSLIGLVVMGLGCAPVYPCIIHSTPARFGADKSQAMIGVQMASAYTGTCLMPPLFGLIAEHINIALFPVYVGALLILMIVMHEYLCRRIPIK
ncbi:MAG: MFS transporter [Clostridia bacterium]|nr:MFS transporter [Clostridia bacterium]